MYTHISLSHTYTHTHTHTLSLSLTHTHTHARALNDKICSITIEIQTAYILHIDPHTLDNTL
jgi:hypothetical protein